MARNKLIRPNPDDKEILEKIQKLLGRKLEQVQAVGYTTRGYAVKRNGAVVGLGLSDCHIGDEKLETIAEMLGTLTSLTTLYLNDNELTELPAIGTLTSLTTLDLHRNQIKEIRPELFNRDWKIRWIDKYVVSGLNLFGNPLETPPVEIVQEGKEAVKNYFDSLKAAKPEDIIRLYEGKLLIVGEGDVGKTFLANRLMFDKIPDGVTTDGIDIHKWMIETESIKDFRVNLWDFAGQEICHATHQFFLTSRSLYVFVWEARTDDDISRFDYWLNVIRLLSDNAPVIMVMNKCDSRTKAIDQAAIKKEFGNVIDFYKISAKEGTGIEPLRERIYKEMEALPQIGKKLPRQWVDIRNRLESMQKRNYIKYQDYVDICGEYDLNADQAANLAQYYHDLGVILHFKDNSVLKHIVILDSEWATDAVYAVVDNLDIQKLHGKFHYSQLAVVWADYPAEAHIFLMELMKKFELCFELPGAKEYIVPELLSPEMPRFEWDGVDNLCFEYKYTFMPAGIITRFTVRQHEIIEAGLYWKNGVCLKWNETKVLIVCDPFGKTISIKIKGVDPKGLLAVIRKDIETIHVTLNHPNHDERIPCVCPKCKANDEASCHSYEKIKKFIMMGKRTIECDGGNNILIDELLGEYGISEEERGRSSKVGGDTYYIDGDYVQGDQKKTGDIEGEMVAVDVGGSIIDSHQSKGSPEHKSEKTILQRIKKWAENNIVIVVLIIIVAVVSTAAKFKDDIFSIFGLDSQNDGGKQVVVSGIFADVAKDGSITRSNKFPWEIKKSKNKEGHILYTIIDRRGDATAISVVPDTPKYTVYESWEGMVIKYTCTEEEISDFTINMKY